MDRARLDRKPTIRIDEDKPSMTQEFGHAFLAGLTGHIAPGAGLMANEVTLSPVVETPQVSRFDDNEVASTAFTSHAAELTPIAEGNAVDHDRIQASNDTGWERNWEIAKPYILWAALGVLIATPIASVIGYKWGFNCFKCKKSKKDAKKDAKKDG